MALQMLDFRIISLRPVASEKINKEYVYKYKYIQRRQNVSDRAVNDNAAGSHVQCVFIPLEGNDLHPSWHFPTAHPQSTPMGVKCICVCMCVTTLQEANTTCPREVPFSVQAIKTTSFSSLWNHSRWNIGSSVLSVFDKSLLWEMFGKQTGDKLHWATASELKEKNVSTAFG